MYFTFQYNDIVKNLSWYYNTMCYLILCFVYLISLKFPWDEKRENPHRNVAHLSLGCTRVALLAILNPSRGIRHRLSGSFTPCHSQLLLLCAARKMCIFLT